MLFYLIILLHGSNSVHMKNINKVLDVNVMLSTTIQDRQNYDIPFAHNCNCGTRIQEWSSGKESVGLCRAACLDNNNCMSFGLWATKTCRNKHVGHCALFDKTCTEKCPAPTNTADGWFNDVYNVGTDDIPFAHNCNCGTRLEQWGSGKGSLVLCRAACLENNNCKSFGLWTTESRSSGHCALFDKACTETCPAQTNTAGGWFNNVYNVMADSPVASPVASPTSSDDIPFAHNCNCGTRLEQWRSGKESVGLCREACLENNNCKSFGLWTTESRSSGHCALFDKACTETCPGPTNTAGGWFNDVYNVGTDSPVASPVASPTSSDSPVTASPVASPSDSPVTASPVASPTASGSAILLPSLRVTASDTNEAIKANPERLFRYYSQAGKPKEPLPIYIDTWGNGLSKVAWCDGTNVHVTTIGTNDEGGEDHTTPGNSVRGLVAHDDGTATVLLKDGTMDCYLVKMSSTGTQIFKTSVDNRCKDFGLGGGRLAWDGSKYGAYYKVHGIEGFSLGHEGDTYKTITGDGQSVKTVSNWGCSHSMEERLSYNPTQDKFGRFCLSDAFPGKGYYYNHNQKNIFAATANQGGYVAGGLGGVVATETGWLFTVTVPQNGASMDTNTDVGLFHLSHTNTIALTGPFWLTNTANTWEMGSHIAKYGKVPDRYLVGWIEKNNGAYFTRSADKFILAVVDSSGKLYGSPTDISSKAMFHERSDFVTFTNGDAGWVATWAGNPPSPSYSSEQRKFYIVRVETSCEPNPCTNPPTCRSSPGICTFDSILGPQCDYSAISPFGEKCLDDSGECDAGGNCDTCLVNGQICPSNNAPQCREGQGTCVGVSNRECQYSTLASVNTVCPGGVCNSGGNCTGDCNDPNCETCYSTASATCTVCSNNKILENGCCLDSICLNVDGIGSLSGDYAEAGSKNGKPYYYNSAKNRYLTFYCCGWGWAITNKAGGGSAFKISDNTVETALGASGTWRGDQTVTITKCDLCADKTCNNPPQCYKEGGVCNQCGACDYVLEPSGTPCTINGVDGACDGFGACSS